MSHVDEGRLHALLDGALEGTAELADLERHLADCAECRGRLDDARTLHSRAGSILRAAPAGEIAAPPFAAVLARKRRGTARPRLLRMNRMVALGWAATVVLAAGVGWIARGSLPFGDQPASARSLPAATERSAAVNAPDEQTPSDLIEADAAEPGAVGAIAGAATTADASAGRREQAAESEDAPAAPVPRRPRHSSPRFWTG